MSPTKSTRRRFLRQAGVSLVALSIGRSLAATKASITARGAARVVGANDRIGVGVIGLGTMGTNHLRDLVNLAQEKKDIEVRAVSDVYQRARKRAMAITGLAEKDALLDYRELLARDDIDAMFIATPDHWHAQMAVDAFAAGKDVYLEKPFTLTLPEALDVVDAAEKAQRVLQVGSEWVSDPRVSKARELFASGAIGRPLWGQSSYGRNTTDGDWNYYVDEEGTPETIDWQRWLGSAPQREFSAERFFRWRKYWDYSNGIASDLWSHKLAPMLSVIGGRYPTRVSGGGGVFKFKDREVPDTLGMVIEYADFMVVFASSMANSTSNLTMKEAIHGDEGTLVFEDNQLLWYREDQLERNKKSAGAPKVFDIPNPKNKTWRLHRTNFLDCVRNRATPNMSGELALQTTVALLLGMAGYRESVVKGFDATAKMVTDKPAPRPQYEGQGKNTPGGWPKSADV